MSNKRCKSAMEAYKSTAVATYFHHHVALLCESFFSTGHRCGCTAVGTVYATGRKRAAVAAALDIVYFLEQRSLVTFYQQSAVVQVLFHIHWWYWTFERWFGSYTNLYKSQTSTMVVREGCRMFGWHSFCNSRTTGTKHVTIRCSQYPCLRGMHNESGLSWMWFFTGYILVIIILQRLHCLLLYHSVSSC
jgi:hypothetical protein